MLCLFGLPLAAASPASPATAPITSCGMLVVSPGSENAIFQIRARGTTCATARKVAWVSRTTSPRRGPYSYTAHGFRCRGRYVRPAGEGYAAWTCKKASARVWFVRV